MAAPFPLNEADRLAALNRYNLLDSLPEPEFDAFTELASYICQTPIALITLIDQDRQWFKAKVGTQATGTPRGIAICAHAILEPTEMLVVKDLQNDARFVENPFVTTDPHLRFYAGAPLVTDDGFALGTLCVFDVKPRQLDEKQLGALKTLSKLVMNQLELRQTQQQQLEELSRFPAESPSPVLRLGPGGEILYANRPGLALLERGAGPTEHLIPAAWQACLADVLRTQTPAELEHAQGEQLFVCRFVPIAARGYVNVYGSDLTERQRAEDQLKAGEAFTRTVLDSLSAEIVVLDAHGTILAVNAAWQTFAQANAANPATSQAIGLNYLAICERPGLAGDAAQDAEIVAGLRAVLDGRLAQYGLEYRCDAPDQTRWFAMTVLPLAGAERGAVVAHDDITARKQIELALQASEQYLRAVVNAAPFGALTYQLEPDGQLLIVDANHSADEILGIDTRALLGQTLEAAFPGLADTELPASYRQVAEHGVPYSTAQLNYHASAISGQFEIRAIQIAPRRMIAFFRNMSELAMAYDETLEGWSRAMDARDKETEGHTQRVTAMTLRLGRRFGLGETELLHMKWGALLHDMGKLGIPDSILLKTAPLTDAEWDIMRQHPVYAYQMLAPIKFLQPALAIPYCHHEKWDGTGYPRQLRGTDIPQAARIFAVADVWDALRSDRPYRAGWPDERVRDHIRGLAGTHFDPQVVEVFLQLGDEA